jgi:hypothetical protein
MESGFIGTTGVLAVLWGRSGLAQHQPENPVGNLPERRSQEVACIPPALIEDTFGVAEGAEALDPVIGFITKGSFEGSC